MEQKLNQKNGYEKTTAYPRVSPRIPRQRIPRVSPAYPRVSPARPARALTPPKKQSLYDS